MGWASGAVRASILKPTARAPTAHVQMMIGIFTGGAFYGSFSFEVIIIS
jgi:hypothetical protein